MLCVIIIPVRRSAKSYWHLVPLAITMIASGCATAYVSSLRSEYAEKGMVEGVFYGEREYPCVYPATRIAATVEIPTWWWPSKTSIGRLYEAWLWPIGAPLSLVDVVCSIASDTIMLPYDFCKERESRGL